MITYIGIKSMRKYSVEPCVYSEVLTKYLHILKSVLPEIEQRMKQEVFRGRL